MILALSRNEKSRIVRKEATLVFLAYKFLKTLNNLRRSLTPPAFLRRSENACCACPVILKRGKLNRHFQVLFKTIRRQIAILCLLLTNLGREIATFFLNRLTPKVTLLVILKPPNTTLGTVFFNLSIAAANVNPNLRCSQAACFLIADMCGC